MKKIFIALFSLMIFLLLQIGCTRIKKLNCNIDIEILKENIKYEMNADIVQVYTQTHRVEWWLREIRCPVIIIENATTKTLDFKTLSVDEYQLDDDGYDLDQGLRIDGYVIAKQIIESCDMTGYNDFMIEFIKKNDLGEPMYSFKYHYDEFIPKKEPKKLVCNTDIDILIEKIKSTTKADTVFIFTHQFDIYLHKIIAPVIVIENATMKSLDFKALPTDKYQEIGGISNYHEIVDNLKIEGYFFAKQLVDHCNMKGFNSLVVDFIKRDSIGYPMYRFRCLYNELMR
jgi:hypothetical protein